VLLFIEGCRGDTSIELDVCAQVEAIDYVISVSLDFWLSGIQLGPVPLFLEALIEAIRIL
jgi:hypothetical protein